jgi:DNA repair photolyase
MLRYETVATCAECGACKKNICQPAKKKFRTYNGIRLTADGFDCALPVTIDSHSFCSYGCEYCFSNFLVGHRLNAPNIGQTSLGKIESIFSGRPGKFNSIIQKALKYDNKRNGYPCAVQLGGLTDPMDNIERQQGWLLKFIDLAIKYNQPVRISTKGNLALVDEYIQAFSKRPEQLKGLNV